MDSPEISVDRAVFDDSPVVAVMIQGRDYELNLTLTDDDVVALHGDLPTAPDERSLTVGNCCDSPVHWSKDSSGTLYIAVGHDCETWDVCIVLPLASFTEILESIDALPVD